MIAKLEYGVFYLFSPGETLAFKVLILVDSQDSEKPRLLERLLRTRFI
jgi:hypothetical protein